MIIRKPNYKERQNKSTFNSKYKNFKSNDRFYKLIAAKAAAKYADKGCATYVRN